MNAANVNLFNFFSSVEVFKPAFFKFFMILVFEPQYKTSPQTNSVLRKTEPRNRRLLMFIEIVFSVVFLDDLNEIRPSKEFRFWLGISHSIIPFTEEIHVISSSGSRLSLPTRLLRFVSLH